MSDILELFPKKILLKDQICVDEIPKFIEIINDVISKKGATSTPYQNVQSTHSTFGDFFNIVQFEPLVRELQQNIYDYATILGYSEETISKFRLTQLWANKVNAGDYLYPHIHSQSIISGAYYLSSDTDDYLEFYDDITDTSFIENNDSRVQRIQCLPGRLLIFKSNLLHGSPKKISTKEKISMSFNVTLSS